MAVADIVIKQESIEAVDLESKILALCKDNGKGISDAIIQQSMPSIPAQQRVMAINRLLSTVFLFYTREEYHWSLAHEVQTFVVHKYIDQMTMIGINEYVHEMTFPKNT